MDLKILTPASAHPVLDPAAQLVVEERLDRQAGPWRAQALDALRRDFAERQQPLDAREPMEVTDIDLVLADGGSVSIRVLRPPGLPGPAAAVLYLHGGGWIMGDRHTHDGLMRRLAIGTGAAVVFVDYALAPGARHPVQNEQAYAALLAVARDARALDLDADRLAVAGDGAGGAIAAAVALMSRARGGPAIRAQVLLCPITAPAGDNASYRAFAEGPGPSADDLRYCHEALLGERAGQASAFVLDTPLQGLAGLPPTLVVTAEADVLRDEGEAYARKLMRAGVPVTALRVGGAIHDFMVLEALRETPGARAALLQAVDLLRTAFAAP